MQSTDQFEHEMERKNNTAVVFKNIDTEDFTHTYAGSPYTIRAGEKLILTYPVAMLLAEHLAMKILRRNKGKKFANAKGDIDKTFNLYPVGEKQAIMQQIVVEQIEQPLEKKDTTEEIEKKKIAALNEKYKDKLDEAPGHTEVSKKDVIVDLEKRGIKFNPRASKEELLELVKQAEMNG